VYAASKLALARFVRRAPSPRHGPKRHPPERRRAGRRRDAAPAGRPRARRAGAAIRALPIPLGGFGRPEQIAAAIAFLVGPDSAFCCGTIFFADGGSDALLRPDAL
jgi:NAD(P)-dependent dehydrogenase (short-subunit alcohol dehydrogenase family)